MTILRLHKLRHLLALSMLTILPVPVSLAGLTNATYYVSSSGGNDQADGRSPQTAWCTLARVNAATMQPGDKILFQRDNLWRGKLCAKSGAAGRPVTYGAYGNGTKPILQGSVAKDTPDAWMQAGYNLWKTLPPTVANNAGKTDQILTSVKPSAEEALNVDVGNIIFDHGAVCGVKKWRREDLRQNGDFWYDSAAQQVWLYSEMPPSRQYHSIELALKKHIIDESGCQYVTYEDLQLRYGAAHGIGGGNTSHITVRRCDISFIGGALQLTRPDGQPVRYGNGIEFWGAGRHNLVEYCRLWEIYDAALTNQGNGSDSEQLDITYRHNVIWNAEYSFEYWNRPAITRTENIVFEHNTCVDAGYGWGHNQRPDNKNGRHLMFYKNSAATRGVVVRNNIFCNTTESCLRMETDWSTGLTLDQNLWFKKSGPLFTFLHQNFSTDQMDAYRAASGFDLHSVIAEPNFRNAAERDYRLAPGSRGLIWTADGQPCGAIAFIDDARK